MDYVSFMRKIEGREPNDTTNSTTEGSRPLDLQGIIEFARGLGYSNCNLEARPDVPDHRADMFWAGYDWFDFDIEMGMHRDTPIAFFWSGRAYQQQQGDTHSEQQDTVPVESPAEPSGSNWIASRYHGAILRASLASRRAAVGGATPSAQPREEPEGGYTEYLSNYDQLRRDEQPLRSTISAEEGGVPSVRDEREGGERSGEDTVESLGSRMERGTGWSVR